MKSYSDLTKSEKEKIIEIYPQNINERLQTEKTQTELVNSV